MRMQFAFGIVKLAFLQHESIIIRDSAKFWDAIAYRFGTRVTRQVRSGSRWYLIFEKTH